MLNQINSSQKFIATEPLNQAGEWGEQQVWNVVCQAFAQRECLAYWRYPIFSQWQGLRREPDILIVDVQLGVIIIEVKSIEIDQIIAIAGHIWQLQNFYTTQINPYQQAEQQLFTLFNYFQKEPTLQNQVQGRILIALPQITQQDWQQRGFDQLPSCPPLIFQDLIQSSSQEKLEFEFIQAIEKTFTLFPGKPLSSQHWKLLKAMIAGTPLFQPPSRQFFLNQTKNQSENIPRSAILAKVREYLVELDLNQEKIGKQIPPGPQRIRGIAGSGKTICLCQKAAMMHLKHPDWKIAVVFFTRSLYDTMTQQLDRWLRHFTGNQRGYQSQDSNLQVLHAWGTQEHPGFYSFLCEIMDFSPGKIDSIYGLKPNQKLAILCSKLIEFSTIPQYFDAILIDESQDLLVEDEFKWEGRQPFFWLVYQALKTIPDLENKPYKKPLKRLIWAEDEAQCLTVNKMATARELFGESWGNLVSDQYPNGINKTERMTRCYRTPELILTVAHGISMGLLRSQGILTGINCAADWEALGYQVQSNSRQFQPFKQGEKIKINYSLNPLKHPLSQLWQQPVIQFKVYPSRQAELTALAEQILYNLKVDGLRPSREILVIILGSNYQAISLEIYVAQFLMQQGIDVFIPGAPDCNLLKFSHKEANNHQFWCEGGVTISRIHRAKGNEADMVYLVGLDRVAEQENSLYLRQQLFIGLTRSRGWVQLSGTGAYPFYDELWQVMKSRGKFTLTYSKMAEKVISLTAVSELLQQYYDGDRNFPSADFSGVNLPGINLEQANFIAGNFTQANLMGANFQQAQLIVADFTGAQLTHANFSQAKLIGATFYQAQLNGANFNQADLRNADLRKAQLVGASLEQTNLEGADLRGAILPDSYINK